MNRAERRRQGKAQQAPEPSAGRNEFYQWLSEAVVHHQSGRLSQAEQLYQRILQRDPHHPEALHLLGLIAFRMGRLDQAGDLIAKAIENEAGKAPYCFNLGIVRQRQGRYDEAVAAYQRALALNPHYVEAQSNLGNVWLEQGRLEDAVVSYRQALGLKPDYVEAHNNLGVALKEQGRLTEAVGSYREALRLNPNHIEALSNLGIVLMEEGRLDEAVVSFERALSIKPDYAKALYNLAFARLWQRQLDQALAVLRQSAALKHDHGRPAPEQLMSRSRLKHEMEQMRYLLDRRIIHESYDTCLQELEQLRKRIDHQGEVGRIRVGREELKMISPIFNRILHYGESPALKEGALNPSLDVPAIEARYSGGTPEVMYVDHLLTDEALQSLRRFCLESTIWKREYENGYLGAFFGDGFACPLLLQIAEELRLRFPGIFKQHLLTQAWAFKYDSELRGLYVHADAAAVNVNFWLTPDGANLDATAGGLIVWDKEAPKEWDFKDYNSSKNEPKVREFLQHSGARAISIPYRANRAVIFNSDLFHETDRFTFKDEYECRRVNVTLLYGRRQR